MDNCRCTDHYQFCGVTYRSKIFERNVDTSTTIEYNNRKVNFVMSDVEFKKHRVFRETQDVIFYDISVEDSNASELVVHERAAVSPPNDVVGAKQFYVHYHQVDHNRVLRGERTFELINPEWTYPYHIVHLNRSSGALVIPRGTWHRSTSGENGSIVINQAIRDDLFDQDREFVPVSAANCEQLYDILLNEKPIIHTLGE